MISFLVFKNALREFPAYKGLALRDCICVRILEELMEPLAAPFAHRRKEVEANEEKRSPATNALLQCLAIHSVDVQWGFLWLITLLWLLTEKRKGIVHSPLWWKVEEGLFREGVCCGDSYLC